MKQKKNTLQTEQGSVQRQTQRNEYGGELGSGRKKHDGNQYGIIPAPHAKRSDNKYKDSKVKPSKDQPDLKEIDDEKVIPGIRTKRSPWNSVDFEADDFFGGFLPA